MGGRSRDATTPPSSILYSYSIHNGKLLKYDLPTRSTLSYIPMKSAAVIAISLFLYPFSVLCNTHMYTSQWAVYNKKLMLVEVYMDKTR